MEEKKSEIFGGAIALASLEIKAIKLQPHDPFTWASGYRMPIYNDNRQLLSQFELRKLVSQGLTSLIEENNVQPEFIVGTSTAGIAPAAGVAGSLGIPLIIFQGEKGEEKPYTFQFVNSVYSDAPHDLDAIASTCPWSIPFAVSVADDRLLPFMYVRQSAKGHGLKRQIEGNPIKGQKVSLIDIGASHDSTFYLKEAKQALEEEGVIVKNTYVSGEKGLVMSADKFMKGKKGVVIEDLISMGGSSADEVQMARNFGADVNHCFSIFSYGLAKADEAFAQLNPSCHYDALLRYDTLLEVAKSEGYLDQSQINLLANWRKDPMGWGEKNGFPKVEK